MGLLLAFNLCTFTWISVSDLLCVCVQEFLCAINGHVMKEPMKAGTSGLVFERATIEVWLGTRGSICPITHQALTKEDLVLDVELRNRYVCVA